MTQTLTEFWLIRHAPVAGHGKIVYGRTDYDAELPGPEMIADVASLLPDEAIWVTTPLKRARQTLDALQAARGGRDPEPVVEPDFMEQDFGQWEGRESEEVWASMPKVHWKKLGELRPPGGETYTEVSARVVAAIDRLTQAHGGKRLVVVAHAGVIRATLAHALSAAPETGLGFAVDPLSVNRADRIGDEWRVQFTNRFKS